MSLLYQGILAEKIKINLILSLLNRSIDSWPKIKIKLILSLLYQGILAEK